MQRSSKWPLSLRIPHQNPVSTSPVPIRATCPAHLILLDLITRIIDGDEYGSVSYSLGSFLHSLLFEHTVRIIKSMRWMTHVACLWLGEGGVRKEYKILLEKSQHKNNLVCLPVCENIINDLCERLATPVIVGWFAGRAWKSKNSGITASIVVKILWYIHNLQIWPRVA